MIGVTVTILMPRYVQAMCKASIVIEPVGPVSKTCDSKRESVRQIEAVVSKSRSLTTVCSTMSSVSGNDK